MLVLNGNNLALVQLCRSVREFYRILAVCRDTSEHGTPVATCGMGSTSSLRYSPTKTIRQIELRENKLSKPFSPLVTERRQLCREDLICTTRVTTGANSCFRDEGNPLYLYRRSSFNESSVIPLCLYGVATGYEPKQRGNTFYKCDGGSSFARVAHFASWIDISLWIAIPVNENCWCF